MCPRVLLKGPRARLALWSPLAAAWRTPGTKNQPRRPKTPAPTPADPGPDPDPDPGPDPGRTPGYLKAVR